MPLNDALPLVPPAAPAWFRFARGAGAHVGAVVPDGRYFDLGPLDVRMLLARGELRTTDLASRIAAAPSMPEPTRVLGPLAAPGKVLCLAKNFAAHAKEFGADVPKEPIFFAKLPDTLAAHGDAVVIPHWLDTRVDHEAELALVLGFADPDGRGKKNLDGAGARAIVAGYTLLNDVTARKLQGQDRDQKYPWLRSKAIDTFGPFGPFVVPADGFDVSDRQLTMRVNGHLKQSASTADMVFSIEQALAAMSRVTTLRPGDLVAMGTPEGVSPVVPGDVMEVAIDGLGVLRNRVAKEAAG